MRPGRRLSRSIVHIRHAVLRLAIGVAFAITPFAANAVVFTPDYNRLALLPALTSAGTGKDWRANGVVTPVKNEGSCDASWAFGVTGLVEAYRAIHFGVLTGLSEQELVDCTGGGSGCGGGNPIDAMRTLIARGGLTNAASYPYTAREGTCKASTPVANSTIPGAGRVPPGDEASLQAYVDQGPVLALVAASTAFDSYAGGTFTGPCPASAPTRAVLIVGYTDAYWIVKNSRGASWGAQGYIYLARGTNLCGIASYAVAVSDDPLPPPPPSAQAIPTLSDGAVLALTLGFAALGFAGVRRSRRKASG
jgi:C1A family cysteine protease